MNGEACFRVVFNVMAFAIFVQLWPSGGSLILTAACWSAGVVLVYLLTRPESVRRPGH